MKKEILQKARELENNIFHTEVGIDSLTEILSDYDNFGISITFLRNSDGYTRSFGGKKYKFKADILQMITALKSNLEDKLKQLNNEFEKI